ncbi:hypothetical protein HHK36_024081 [Tetracentron sinense]|uniref:Uncharacterized protein n=1 Tax=Tetracentron sinense TaxID=13715 RepID=A0A834YMM7_TETSI|nr:hypothetical protein HHK36_024081 [Tetracentron sinense]
MVSDSSLSHVVASLIAPPCHANQKLDLAPFPSSEAPKKCASIKPLPNQQHILPSRTDDCPSPIAIDLEVELPAPSSHTTESASTHPMLSRLCDGNLKPRAWVATRHPIPLALITQLVCINETLTDDELRAILAKLLSDKDKDDFGLVCKRWLLLQSTERKKLCARAGPLMLRKMAARFSRLVELDLSQSISRSFYPGVTDSDLSVIAAGFSCLRILNLQHCKGSFDTLIFVAF